ncbi:hypothetical protein VNO77_33012 [Canavalia gladiata]|uniref:Uncharacterized protein n=1 Tax=Canavalia gladiata TaxID=3824 RepID=A0AAN9KBL5_CANGL
MTSQKKKRKGKRWGISKGLGVWHKGILERFPWKQILRGMCLYWDINDDGFLGRDESSPLNFVLDVFMLPYDICLVDFFHSIWILEARFGYLVVGTVCVEAHRMSMYHIVVCKVEAESHVTHFGTPQILTPFYL